MDAATGGPHPKEDLGRRYGKMAQHESAERPMNQLGQRPSNDRWVRMKGKQKLTELWKRIHITQFSGEYRRYFSFLTKENTAAQENANQSSGELSDRTCKQRV